MLLISHKHPSLMWEQRRADPPELLMSFQISQRILGGGGRIWGEGQNLLYIYERAISIELELAQMIILRLSSRLLNR